MSASPLERPGGGLAVDVAPWRRNERGPLVGLKCASYAENLVALDAARRSGFDETLFFNTADKLCEAATANVFLIRGGRLGTPPESSGCLPGVARQVLMALARREGLGCVEEDLSRADLDAADGIFLTSVLRGPAPVIRCGLRELPCPELAGRLARLWREAVSESAGTQNPKDLAFPDGVHGVSSGS
jgi:branched-chain amino acid aminotransferase